ncbi:DUF2169 family type VI secretion system accessory protein [Nautilia lithotrophica]
MKIIKSNKLGFFYKYLQVGKRKFGVFSYYLGFDLLNGKVLNYNELLEKVSSICEEIQDEGFPKLNAEFLVCGSAYAYDNETSAVEVGIKVGNYKKSLVVFGERDWKMGIPTKPKPFKSKKVKYYDNSENPPVIEYKNRLVTSKNDTYIPASFTPLSFKMRTLKGNFKDYEKFWPYFPEEFDFDYFNLAPKDQRISGYFKNEKIEIYNMHPKYPLITSEIPEIDVRCFMKKNDNFYEIKLKKDTLWVYPDILCAIVIFRGVVDVKDELFSDIEYVYGEIEYEKKDESFYYESFLKKIRKIPDMEKEEILKPQKMPDLKIAKRIKTFLNQILQKKPSIKFDTTELMGLLPSGQSGEKFLDVLGKIEDMKIEMHNLKNSIKDIDFPKKSELLYPEIKKGWADDGFIFVNECAKRLLRRKIYPDEFIKLSLIGVNTGCIKSKWGDTEVEIPKGMVFARFDGNKLKSVRIKNNEGELLVKGSDEKFPLVLIENEKYPFFVTKSDLEGWMVNFECYDMCNVIVTDNFENITEIIKDSPVYVFDETIPVKNKIVIQSEKTIESLFNEKKLREVFENYLTPDLEYENSIDFDEVSNEINKKIEKELSYAKEKSEKFKKEMAEELKKHNIEDVKSEFENVDNKEYVNFVFNEIQTLFQNNINGLKDPEFKEILINKQKEFDEILNKKDVFLNLITKLESEFKVFEDRMKEMDDKFKKIERPEKKERRKIEVNELKSGTNIIYELDEKNKTIENQEFKKSVFKGKIENIIFKNCVFEQSIINMNIVNCKFIDCKVSSNIFQKDILSTEMVNFEKNIFENISINGTLSNFKNNNFIECNISCVFENLENCRFNGCNITNTEYKGDFRKNSYNECVIANLDINGNLNNDSFIKTKLENIMFKGIMNKLRFLKETSIKNCSFQKTELSFSTFFEIKIENCNFIKCVLNNSLFNKNSIEFSDFRKAEMKKVRFEFNIVKKSNFAGANLFHASFRGSRFEDVSFFWSNLSAVEMFNVKFKNVIFDNANLEKTHIKREYIEQ